MNGKNNNKEHIKKWRIVIIAAILFGVWGFLHASGLLYGEQMEDPRGGMPHEFEDVSEMFSMLPEDNLLLNFPIDRVAINHCDGICKFDTTDYLDYEQYFHLYMYGYDSEEKSVSLSCSIDDPNSSRKPMEWNPGFYTEDKIEILEIENIIVYYSSTSEHHQAMFYVDTDIYELKWYGESKEEFLKLLEEIIG